jgi:hypothetical protein
MGAPSETPTGLQVSPRHPLLRPMHAERELKAFIFVSALDIFATYILLRIGGFTESNPVAAFFLFRWGVKGLVYFKLGMVAFVCILAHVISLQQPQTALRLLQFATLVVGGVVVYSVYLFVKCNQVFL